MYPSNVCMVITYSMGKDQPGKVTNLARGQLNRENNISLSAFFAPGNLVSRTGSAVPSRVSLLISILSGYINTVIPRPNLELYY